MVTRRAYWALPEICSELPTDGSKSQACFSAKLLIPETVEGMRRHRKSPEVLEKEEGAHPGGQRLSETRGGFVTHKREERLSCGKERTKEDKKERKKENKKCERRMEKEQHPQHSLSIN